MAIGMGRITMRRFDSLGATALILLSMTACGSLQTPKAPPASPDEVRQLVVRGDALEAEVGWVLAHDHSMQPTVTVLRRWLADTRSTLNRSDVGQQDISQVKETYTKVEKDLAEMIPDDRVTVETCADDPDIALVYEVTCPAKKAEQAALAANPPHQCKQHDVADCTKECERGHGGSCEHLARMYLEGAGVEADEKKATRFLIRACLYDQVSACGEAGNAIVEGIGIEPNGPRGETLLLKSCDARDPFGCFRLGRYRARSSDPEVLGKVARLYQFACDNDFIDGCVNLGVMYANGRGVPKDKKKAAEYFTHACEKGEQVGCDNLAVLQGKRPPASPAQIEQLWKELVAVADDLASKRFIARYAAEQARGTQGQRQVQLMQQHMAEFQREEYCPARKAFVEAAGQAEFRKRSQTKCKDDPPVAGGLHGPENLTADCQAVFAGGCP